MLSKKMKKISLFGLGIVSLITIPVLVTACSSTPSTSEINNTNNASLLESDQAKEGVLGFWQNSIITDVFSNTNPTITFNSNSAFNYTSNNSSTISILSLNEPANTSYNSYRLNIINAYNSYIAYNSQISPVTWWNNQITTWLKNANLAGQINQNNLYNPSLTGQDYCLNTTTINQILNSPSSLNETTLGAQQFNNLSLFLILFNNISSQMQSLLNSFYLSYIYLTQQNMSNIQNGSDYSTNINNTSSADFGTISNINPNNPNFFLIKYLLSNTLVQEWQFNSSNAPTIFQNEQISSLTSFNNLFQSSYLGSTKKESSQFNIGINDQGTDSSSIFGYNGVQIANSSLTDGSFSSNINTIKTFNQTMSGILNPNTNMLIPFAALGNTGRNQILNSALAGLKTNNLVIQSNSSNITTITANDLAISSASQSQLTNSGISLSITNVSSSTNNLSITFNINSSSTNFSKIQPLNFTMNTGLLSSTNTVEIPFSSILSNLQSELITSIPVVNNKTVEATYYNRLLPIFNVNSKPSSDVSSNVSQSGLFTMVQTPWATATPSTSDPEALYGSVNPYLVYSIIFSTYKAPSSSDASATNAQNLAYSLFVTTKDFYIKLGYTITVGNFAGNSGLISEAKALGLGD